MTSKKKSRITIGCRAKILDKSSWGEEYGGREVLLKERTSGGKFAVMLLGKDVENLEKEKSGIIANEMAWVPEDALELVNKDFDTNLDYMDWYEEHKDDFCGDCLAWFPGNDEAQEAGEYLKCPNKECPSNNLEDYEDFD